MPQATWLTFLALARLQVLGTFQGMHYLCDQGWTVH